MALTVGELKNMIEFMDEDTEVRFAMQPSWPLMYSLDSDTYVERDGILYLAEYYQEGYLTEGVADELGW